MIGTVKLHPTEEMLIRKRHIGAEVLVAVHGCLNTQRVDLRHGRRMMPGSHRQIELQN